MPRRTTNEFWFLHGYANARNTQLFDAISILATQQATLIAEGYELPWQPSKLAYQMATVHKSMMEEI